MARRATWIVLLALLLAPIIGGGAVAPVFAQDGDNQTAVADATAPSDEVTADDATPDAEPTDEPTAEASPTESATPAEDATPTEEATPTEDASPTDEATPTEEPTATEEPTETASPTATQEPTQTATAAATATSGVGAAEAPAETKVQAASTLITTLADVQVTINCTSNPEKIRVTNNGKHSIIVESIGSIYRPINAEPVAVNKKIWAGKSRLWLAGPTASGASALIDRLIFKDSVYDKEGVIVKTSVGTITVLCPPPPPTSVDQIKVTINCTSDPEKIRVTNNGLTQITVKSITTLYQPSAQEPFTVNTKLNPTRTQLWTAGGNATGHVLTKNYILTNAAYDKEGVKVVTTAGTITVRCPKSPDPFGGAKWIEVNLSTQYLIAWQNGVRVNETYVSTGRPGFETPTGTWYVNTKIPLQDMSGCIQGECYYVPDVPWVMYFTDWGHALHGAYWHNNFGHVMSHGCVNLPVDFSEWLYYWTPIGTPVVIHY